MSGRHVQAQAQAQCSHEPGGIVTLWHLSPSDHVGTVCEIQDFVMEWGLVRLEYELLQDGPPHSWPFVCNFGAVAQCAVRGPQAGKPADGKQLGCGTPSRASLCPSHLEAFWKTLPQVLSLLFLCEEGKEAVWKRG